MEEPLNDLSLSVIVPVKNSAMTVRDLLDSLMMLDYDKEKLEIIIVDGNSTDGTRKIVSEYPVMMVDEDGRGLNAARNTGVKWASGQILAYTDGDCVVPPEWAQNIVKNFRDPNVSFVGGLVRGYDQEDFISRYMDETFFQAKPTFRWRSEETDLSLLNFPAGCNMAFRRSSLAKINFFDERIDYGFDDLDPVEKLGSRGFKIVLDPDVSVFHQHRTQLMEMLKQHFNYGRGGTLLIIAKRTGKLAGWFTTYLITSTVALGSEIFLFSLGLWANSWWPIRLGINFATILFGVLLTFYIGTAIKTRSLKKLFLYPILDIARGIFFTLGGITQLFKELRRKTSQNI
jgi:glycosyltransferase involved in cell wall biosynthesis